MHAEIAEELDQIQFYFPYLQHSWDRGTNENTNRPLREYFLKEMDITNIPKKIHLRKSR